MQIHHEGAWTRLQQNRVEVSIYLSEFFIVFKVKNNNQLYRANATANKNLYMSAQDIEEFQQRSLPSPSPLLLLIKLGCFHS